jgi:hypothetical protein
LFELDEPGAVDASSAGDGDTGDTAAPEVHHRLSAAEILDHVIEPGALAGAIPMMALSPVIGFVVFFAGLFGTSIGVGNASVFYTVGAVTMVVVRLSSGSFMDRVAAIRIFGIACPHRYFSLVTS